MFFRRSFYFDSFNGAAIATRALLEYLSRQGFATEVLCGTIVDGDFEGDPLDWFSQRGWQFASSNGAAWTAIASGVRSTAPHLKLRHNGVNVSVLRRDFHRYEDSTLAEAAEVLPLLDMLLESFKPDVLLTFGGDSLTRECISRARRRSVATVFSLHNFFYNDLSLFSEVDAVVVPSQFASEYYKDALGLECTVLPNLVDPNRVKVEQNETKYVTFVNPSIEKGVYAFARIADELGRQRPDIPILVVESRGTEETVAACGLDLRAHGNVFFLSHTQDPRDFWRQTRLCIMPSLFWESQGLVAVEALINGIPVIASDRVHCQKRSVGQAWSCLFQSTSLPQPDNFQPPKTYDPGLNPSTGSGTTAKLTKTRQSAIEQSKPCDPEVLGPKHLEFFRNVAPREEVRKPIPRGRAKSVVLVPHLNSVEWPCEESLRNLEKEGLVVVRREGCSQIDLARNEMASEALHDGFESLLFIDADIGFDPTDAFRLLVRPEAIVCGVYPKKGRRELSCRFPAGVEEVILGPHSPGLYPLEYAATGFLRIRSHVLRDDRGIGSAAL